MNTILNQRLFLFFLLFALKNVVCGNKIILLEQVRPSIFNVCIIPIPSLLLDRSLLFYSHVVKSTTALDPERGRRGSRIDDCARYVYVYDACTHTYASCIPATVTK